MRDLFYSDSAAPSQSMRSEPSLPLLVQEHKAMSTFLFDLELVALLLCVAFLVHSAASMVWARLHWRHMKGALRKGDKGDSSAKVRRGTYPRDLPPPSYGTAVFTKAVHAQLSGPVCESELLPFLQEHMASFSTANTVHAIVKCGKLQIKPGPIFSALLSKVAAAVPKLKVRGLAHVLWGIARVEPSGDHGELCGQLVDCLCGKWQDLKPGDVQSAVWAAAELHGDGSDGRSDRTTKVLSCGSKALQASLPSFTTEELSSLLEVLATEKLASTECVNGSAPMAVSLCTALLNAARAPKVGPQPKSRKPSAALNLPLPEAAKVVVALQALVKAGVVGTDREPGALLTGLAARVADVRAAKGQLKIAVHTISQLRPEDVGVQCFDKLARSAVLLNFASLQRKHLVELAQVMAPVAAKHELECGSEFFLELAQQLNSQPLGKDSEALRAAFEQVGYASMLRA